MNLLLINQDILNVTFEININLISEKAIIEINISNPWNDFENSGHETPILDFS